MKLEKKKIIAIILTVLMIVAGIVTVCVWGFNKELRFEESQRIDIYAEQKIDKTKVKNIVNEVLGSNNMVQTVQIYEETVVIRAKNISEEQKNNIVNKIKEHYEFEQTAEKTNINTVPATRIRDMYKKYVLPFAISGVLIAVYITIRYYKKGILNVLAKAVTIPVVAQLLLLSIIAITRIPMGRFIPTLMILVYIASVWYTMKKIEK